MTINVAHNISASRFEATVDGHLAVAEYKLRDDVLVLTHTEVPQALAGRGIGGALAEAALAHARAQGLKVEPRCSYMAGYMKKRPETHELLAASFSFAA